MLSTMVNLNPIVLIGTMLGSIYMVLSKYLAKLDLLLFSEHWFIINCLSTVHLHALLTLLLNWNTLHKLYKRQTQSH